MNQNVLLTITVKILERSLANRYHTKCTDTFIGNAITNGPQFEKNYQTFLERVCNVISSRYQRQMVP